MPACSFHNLREYIKLPLSQTRFPKEFSSIYEQVVGKFSFILKLTQGKLINFLTTGPMQLFLTILIYNYNDQISIKDGYLSSWTNLGKGKIACLIFVCIYIKAETGSSVCWLERIYQNSQLSVYNKCACLWIISNKSSSSS